MLYNRNYHSNLFKNYKDSMIIWILEVNVEKVLR